jgi:hypothetical protein
MSVEEGFELRRHETDITEKRFQLRTANKFGRDAIERANYWNARKKKLGKFTREEFQAAQRDYWKERLSINASDEKASGGVKEGTITALRQMGISVNYKPDGAMVLVDFGSFEVLKENSLKNIQMIEYKEGVNNG